MPVWSSQRKCGYLPVELDREAGMSLKERCRGHGAGKTVNLTDILWADAGRGSC